MTPGRRVLQALTVVVATAGGVLAGHYGMQYLEEGPSGPLAVDQTLEGLRQTPLVRLVFADVPGAEARIRTALEEDRDKPLKSGPTRAFAVMTDLRATYILPALRAADDPSALAAVAARSALLRRLQATDLAACREFALIGLQRVDRLEAQTQELFRATLSALEQAYRSGRDSKFTARPVPTDQEVGALLTDAGFQPADFEKLQHMKDLPDVEICVLAARINTSPTQVAADRSGPLARYLLSNQ